MPASPRILSGSTDGRGITVTGTTATGTLIHTAVSGTSVGKYDEIYLFGYGTSTINRLLTLEWGRSSVQTGQQRKMTISGRKVSAPLIPGERLQNARQLRAFAEAASVIVVHGWVNRLTTA